MIRATRWPDIGLIHEMRKDLQMTQQQLSKLSGVPQPVISRIEGGSIENPSYQIIRRIFEALEASQVRSSSDKGIAVPHVKETQNRKPLVASDLMNKNLVSVRPYTKVKEAWSIMKKEGFSQLPVIDDRGRIVGGVTESSFLSNDLNEILEMRTEDVMADSFPIVGLDTKLQTLVLLLKAEPAVLVVEKGKAAGIITAFDLMGNAFARDPSLLR